MTERVVTKESVIEQIHTATEVLDETERLLRTFKYEVANGPELDEHVSEGLWSIYHEYNRAKDYWEERKEQGFTIEAALAEQYFSAMCFVISCFKESLEKEIGVPVP